MKTTKKITINPARLQWCCEAIDVDIDHLSNDINIAKTTLQKAEVSIQQLTKIAKYFNRGLLFFLNELILFAMIIKVLIAGLIVSQKKKLLCVNLKRKK